MARALVIRTAGTNCDAEMVRAFEMAGAATETVHLERLIAEPGRLDEVELIGFPGGFSYGDDVASGRIFAVRVREHLYPALRSAAARGCLMIGACNGFQVMVQVGLLPGPVGGGGAGGNRWEEEREAGKGGGARQVCSLTQNAGGTFIDRWVRVRPDAGSVCVWTRGVMEAFTAEQWARVGMLPIAHGEGRFIAESEELLARLAASGQIALRYEDNPNGSQGDVAGICDATGRIFALMPHPERYLQWHHHPFWTRLDGTVRGLTPPGLMMFRNAVEAASGVSV